MSQVRKAWKFLDRRGDSIRSRSGDQTWRVGEWYHVDGPVDPCAWGFHCSDQIRQAFSYVPGTVLAEVEVKGATRSEGDKSTWSDMRITHAWKFSKRDAVELAVFTAELVVENFERVIPGDDRPRKAIEAARAWLAATTDDGRSAAESAARSAAWSAESAAESAARSAAWSAARSARSAARSAESAAWSAESAARSAAWSAARSAESELFQKVEEWFQDRLSSLEEIS